MSESALYPKILVAFDGSEYSEEACNFAAVLAKHLGSKIILAHVLPAITTYTAPLRAEDQGGLENKANLAAMKMVSKMQQMGIESTPKILVAKGSTADTMIDFATSEKIDLIIAGTRGLGAFRRMILGSVSTNLLNHANCPVLVVRKRVSKIEAELGKILVATDGSNPATDAVKQAIGIAAATGSKLTLANVVYVPPLAYTDAPPVNIDRTFQDLRADGERIVGEAQKLAKASGVNADTTIIDNNRSPVWAITKLAEDGKFDLTVLGTRGMGGLRRTVMGSVANGIVHYAECSVLVTR
jgi:nucleotide-binding universal stress UspA family protein